MTADAVGGVWTYVLALVKALAQFNVDVLVATLGPKPMPSQLRAATDLSNLRLATSNYRLEWMDDGLSDLGDISTWLSSLENKWQPDIIHLNSYSLAALPWRAPTVVVAHSCVLSWWQAVYHSPPPDTWHIYHSGVSAGIASATLVVAPSNAMLSALCDLYGSPRVYRVIYNGLDPALFRAAEKQPFIFGLGRIWDASKNYALLDDIASRLPWPVFIAGSVGGRGISATHRGQAQLIGELSHYSAREWLSKASIFVAPSRYEPFGLAPLEAGLSGCALVLGDIPSLREIWQDAALFVPPNRPDILLETINCLVGKPAECRGMARRARERALFFSTDRMGRSYWEAYATILGRNKGQSASCTS